MQIYTLCWNTQCAGLFSGRGATPRPSHSVFKDTDLHTVLGYAMCRAFLGSRCITLAEPSFTPIHTDKVGKSPRHGITPTVRALFWMQNYNCVGIRNCRAFLGSRCNTLAEPSIHLILVWRQNYNCVGIRNCRAFLESRCNTLAKPSIRLISAPLSSPRCYLW